ncbi:hypothetical protein [Nocardioides sp.]|uniref:hypothetical protein n=1 Tax=Nocardioides sp. TaxID=35761 RepID=UPI003564E070
MAKESSAQETEPNWKLRAIVGLAALVLLGLLYLFGVTVIPRWWAHWVGDRVGGSLVKGTTYGLVFGSLFTLLPLAIARQALRPMDLKVRLGLVLAALMLAAPNLMTLGIVVGSGNAAHAGERILDVEGSGFRTASALGAGAALVLAGGMLVWSWRTRRPQ